MTTLFDIKHENDLSEYDSTVTDGGDLSQGSPGLAKTAGRMEALIDDTTSIYGQKNQAAPGSNEIRFRCYIDPNNLTMASGDNFVFLMLRVDVHVLRLRYDGANYEIRSVAYDDNGSLVAQTDDIADAEHYIEVHIERASSDIAADGRVRYWLDGVLTKTWPSVDNWDAFTALIHFRFGAAASIDAGTSGTLHLDELRANDDGKRIGPVGLSARIDHHYRTRRL